MALAPITIGMVGLSFGLWANGLHALGVDAEPATAEGPNPAKAVAVTGSATAAITLLFMSAFLIIGSPLGTQPAAVHVQLLFSAITGMYGLQFVGTTVVQVLDWDARIVGNIALLGAILQVPEMALLAHYAHPAGFSDTHLVLQELVLLAFTISGMAIWAGTHGKISSRLVGTAVMFSFVGTLYFLFFSGGLLTPPS